MLEFYLSLYDFKYGKIMCKRAYVGTYLNMNALQANAQSFFFPITIAVGHFLYRECGRFFIYMRLPRSKGLAMT